MKFRPQQIEAIEAVHREWEKVQSTLVVMPTGIGKTQVFTGVLKDRPGRTLIVAHREELIFQAHKRVEEVAGIEADIEMADLQAGRNVFNKKQVVVTTIQTQIAGYMGGRMKDFDPMEFNTLILDEAHHCVSPSQIKLINYYKQNPNLKILGVTATPDRLDKAAMGLVFQSVAYHYTLPQAIDDGWLVPIKQRMVHVQGLDFSHCRTTAGDLNGSDLAEIYEAEKMLHAVAAPTIELSGNRRTLVFAASVTQAERLAEIINRYKPDSARFIYAKTNKDERRDMLSAYAEGKFQYLINVGVCTEGYDCPGIELVVLGRKTKSRALYCQMIGRATRPLPGLVDGIEDAAERKAAIAASTKPHAEVLDFVGNAGRHKLVSLVDLLGGKFPTEARERAARLAEGMDGVVDVEDLMEDAVEQLQAEREQAKKEEEARRLAIVAKAKFKVQSISPFDVWDFRPARLNPMNNRKEPTPKMINVLLRNGIDPEPLTYNEIVSCIRQIIERMKMGLCTYKQAKTLMKFGYDCSKMSMKDASTLLDQLARNKWKRIDTPSGAMA